MKTVLYIHGLASTRNSATVANLRKYLPQFRVEAYDVPFDPVDAAKFVSDASKKCDLMVGSSLGGFYAQIGAPETPRILINPALHAASNIFEVSGYGTYEYFGPRTDGIQTFETSPEYYEKLGACEQSIARDMTEEQALGTHIIFGNADEVLGESNHGLCMERYSSSNIVMTNMMHRVSEECVRNIIAPLAVRILG